MVEELGKALESPGVQLFAMFDLEMTLLSLVGRFDVPAQGAETTERPNFTGSHAASSSPASLSQLGKAGNKQEALESLQHTFILASSPHPQNRATVYYTVW